MCSQNLMSTWSVTLPLWKPQVSFAEMSTGTDSTLFKSCSHFKGKSTQSGVKHCLFCQIAAEKDWAVGSLSTDTIEKSQYSEVGDTHPLQNIYSFLSKDMELHRKQLQGHEKLREEFRRVEQTRLYNYYATNLGVAEVTKPLHCFSA